MLTKENHSCEKWFEEHNLTFIGKHTLTRLFLRKMMLPTKVSTIA